MFNFTYTVYPQDESNDIIAELRDEIQKLRSKITSSTEPNSNDVLKLEVLWTQLGIPSCINSYTANFRLAL